jgi:hypothetical protein
MTAAPTTSRAASSTVPLGSGGGTEEEKELDRGCMGVL